MVTVFDDLTDLKGQATWDKVATFSVNFADFKGTDFSKLDSNPKQFFKYFKTYGSIDLHPLVAKSNNFED